MKVSLSWLKELVDFDLSVEDLANKLSLISIGVKQQTEGYLELDLTYNRGDLLSLRGVAYEVSALTEAPLRFLAETPEDFVWVGKDSGKTPIEIEEPSLSQVQCIAKIEGLKVEPSPKEWVKKLEDCGMRSVNNIADITNLMMLEFGQPFHAFDAKTVSDETIIVRRAKKDEEIKTLDNKIRKLTSEDIVLADTKGPLDVGGVMGGKDTEIKDSTTTILLSASMFNPIMVRKTSKRLGLYSEASKRFQHGLSSMRLLQALNQAIRMYQQMGGKLTAINMVGDFNQPKKTINLSIKKTNDLLGINLDQEAIIECLKKLNFTVRKTAEDTLEVTAPYFRLDINIQEDVIEEVARIYGYDKIEGKPLGGVEPDKLNQALQEYIQSLKEDSKEAGLTEVQTYSFYSTRVLDALGFDENNKDKIIRIANPISKETEVLREFIWPNLIEVVARNIKEGFKDIAVFEIGKVYFPQIGQLPQESYRLAIALMNNTDNPIEELISIFQNLRLHPKGVNLKSGEMMKELETVFHPKRYASIEAEGKQIGGLAEVHPRFLSKLGVSKRVAILEIALEGLI